MTRHILLLGTGLLLLGPNPAQAQRAPLPRVNPFAIALWADLTSGLGYSASIGRAKIDFTLPPKPGEEDITVTAKRRHWEEAPIPGLLPGETGWSDAAGMHDQSVVPPNHCEGAAYRIIGGQPATSNDLIGFDPSRC
jgi:hypothetical protein